jgi:L-ribulose-5-phosphate 4-epimerase
MLNRAGYSDNHAGHLSYRQDDGTLLIAPWELTWAEVRASDILRVTAEGELLEGDLTPNPALRLHYELYKARPDVRVIVHNHPTWATVWAATRSIPPVYDQMGAFVRDDLVLYDDFQGGVSQEEGEFARANVEALGSASMALLANHGVLVVGETLEQVHLRAVVLEHRCRLAWRVESLGPQRGVPVEQAAADRITRLFEEEFGGWPHFYEAMTRQELRADESVLD